MPRGPGTIQKKILLLLLGGLALGLSRSPTKYFKILRMIGKEWEEINRKTLWRAIRALYQSKLITGKYEQDGSFTMVLSNSGRKRALTYKLEEMVIEKPKKWDRKWRIIIFDVPEKKRNARDALRSHFQRIGLRELQKSVFVYPYPCEDEINFIIEFFQMRPHVRIIIAESFDNELHYRQKFGLL